MNTIVYKRCVYALKEIATNQSGEKISPANFDLDI